MVTCLPDSFVTKGNSLLVSSWYDRPSSSFSFRPVEAFPISRKFPCSSLQDRVNDDRIPKRFPFPYSAAVITRSSSFSAGFSFSMWPTLAPGLYSEVRFFIISPS